MGSTDALSIIYRDIILFVFSKYITEKTDDPMLKKFNIEANKGVLNALESLYEEYDWGVNF